MRVMAWLCKYVGVCISVGDVTPERLAKWCSAIEALKPKGGYWRSVIRGRVPLNVRRKKG